MTTTTPAPPPPPAPDRASGTAAAAGSARGAGAAADEDLRPRLRGWLHVGAFVAVVVAGPFLVARAPDAGTAVALTVYVLSLLALFGVSAAFHRIRWGPAARRRMRRADHSTIFLGIAGSYTAVSVCVLHGWALVTILLLVWVGGAAGIAVRQFLLDAPKWAVAVPYVVVGWSALVAVPQLVRGLGGAGFALLVVGGVAYSVGAVVYSLRRPDPRPAVFGYHEVFHACTVVGATLHFVAIFAFAVPRA